MARWRFDASGPRITEIPGTTSATAPQIATQCAEALKKSGHGASPILLAIPSSWCLAGSIRTDDLPRSDAKSLIYRLEEKLPWPAESIVADFIRHEQSALGVCIRIDCVRAMIDALEAEGIAVQIITPTAFLAADAQSNSESSLVQLNGINQVDLIATENGQPIFWAVSTTDPADLKLQTNLLLLDLPKNFPQTTISTEDYYTSAALTAHLIMQGRRSPLIGFRRGELAARGQAAFASPAAQFALGRRRRALDRAHRRVLMARPSIPRARPRIGRAIGRCLHRPVSRLGRSSQH